MRRRDWGIVAGILVPFSLLCWLSFQRLGGAPAGFTEVDAGAAVTHVEVTTQREARVSPPVDSGSEPAQRLDPVLQAVTPEVLRCLSEDGHGAKSVRVRWGAGKRARVDTQDPYLAACIEDVFDDLGRALPPPAQEHVFSIVGRPRP